MRITLEKILFHDHQALAQVRAIYEEAFPVEERRDFDQICLLIESNPNFNCMGIFNGDKLVGLLTYWALKTESPFAFSEFAFGEHLAIDASMRGQSIGSLVLEKFAEMAQLPILLEVEHPTTEQAIQRIRFYEKSGFKLWELDYVQPPYGDNLPPVPLYLMSLGEVPLDTHFDEVRDTLYRQVYGLTEEI